MRLKAVENGHGLKEKVVLGLVARTVGDAPDVIRAQLHRPEFFGRPFGAITQRAMRGESDWTVADRELFAAFVSTRNRCEFCAVCHTEFASQAGDRAEVERMLQDGARGNGRIAAAFEFLAAFVDGADAIEDRYVWQLRRAGVRDRAIRDLAQIAFSFCLINRVADALEFKVLTPEQFARGWPAMRDRGYAV